MLYLSLVELPRSAWDRGDLYQAHRYVWKGFPGHSPGDRPFLYSLDESDTRISLLVQSSVRPEMSAWVPRAKVSVKTFDPADMASVGRKTFKLKATPTKDRAVQGGRGERIPVGADLGPSSPTLTGRSPRETALLLWLQERGERYGFKVDPSEVHVGTTVRQVVYKRATPLRRGETPMVFHEVTFRGVLDVVDNTLFEYALREGIGRARGFGYGFLMVFPKM